MVSVMHQLPVEAVAAECARCQALQGFLHARLLRTGEAPHESCYLLTFWQTRRACRQAMQALSRPPLATR